MQSSAKIQADRELYLGEIIAKAISADESEVSIFSQFALGNDLVINFIAFIPGNDPVAKLNAMQKIKSLI